MIKFQTDASIEVKKLTLSFEDRASALIGAPIIDAQPNLYVSSLTKNSSPSSFGPLWFGTIRPPLEENQNMWMKIFSQWFFHSTSRESALVLEYNFINRLLIRQKRMVVIWFGYCNWNLVPGLEHLIIMRRRNFGRYLLYTPANLFLGFIQVFGFCQRWGSVTALFWLDSGGTASSFSSSKTFNAFTNIAMQTYSSSRHWSWNTNHPCDDVIFFGSRYDV